MTTAPPTQTTWSVNRLAARAVAVHGGGTLADRLELLEALGLIAGDDRREILPDDTRPNVMVDLGKAPGGKNPDASSPLSFADHGRRPEGMTTPPGLRDLPPLPEPPKRARKTPTAPKPARQRKPRPTVTAAPRERKRAAVAVCGTTGGYSRHSRLGEPVCGPCRDAKNTYWRDHDARRRTEQGQAPRRRKVAACGTPSGYMRHLRQQEPTCAACRKANNDRVKGQHARRNAETNRLISAGVNPQTAAILGERTAAAS